MLNCGWDNYRRCSKIHQSGWPFTWKFNLKSSLSICKIKARKLWAKSWKKPCQTRWLSFQAATSDIFIDYLAVQQTLRQLKDEDAVASGLLSKVNTAKFIRVIYILNPVLPILSCLSKTFQKGANNEWTSGITTHNDFGLDKSLMGLKVQILLNKSPIDLFELMFTDDYYDIIVTRTKCFSTTGRPTQSKTALEWPNLCWVQNVAWLVPSDGDRR